MMSTRFVCECCDRTFGNLTQQELGDIIKQYRTIAETSYSMCPDCIAELAIEAPDPIFRSEPVLH